jgi:Putative addiction module component
MWRRQIRQRHRPSHTLSSGLAGSCLPRQAGGVRIDCMGTSADALLDSALKLPGEQRAPEAGVEAAWDAEVQRRLEQVDRGEVELLDWNAVKTEVAQALKRR